MEPEQAPPIGAFLRPVGRSYAYCLRVVKVHPPDEYDEETCVEFERWGMENGTPIKDGYQNHVWLSNLVPALPGVWREQCPYYPQPRHWAHSPLYYRQMDIGPSSQMELI